MKSVTIATALVLLGGCNTFSIFSSSDQARDIRVQPTLKAEPETMADAFTVPYEVLPESKENIDLWAELQESFELTVPDNIHASVDTFAAHQTRLPTVVSDMLHNSEPYLYYIMDEIKKRNMPSELALIPLVESNFNPQAFSSARAAGLWQFIPMTAKRFKLTNNQWLDERRDVVASTEAALDYLDYLHTFFDGDWLLAVAAYNAGEGTVQRAMRRNKKAGLPTDFGALRLPKETTAYVPKILAWAKVLKNPSEYNLSLKTIKNQPHFAALDIGQKTKLSDIAMLADTPVNVLNDLNPAFKRGITTANATRLLVPANKAHLVAIALAKSNLKTKLSGRSYVIQVGDSLSLIAQRHGVSLDKLKAVNALSDSVIYPGQVLVIPDAVQKLASRDGF